MRYSSIFSQTDLYCRRWLDNKERFCMNRAGRMDERSCAEQKRALILTMDPWDPQIFSLLKSLAVMVHCRNHHRTSEQILNTAMSWQAELQRRSRRSPARERESHAYTSNCTRFTSPPSRPQLEFPRRLLLPEFPHTFYPERVFTLLPSPTDSEESVSTSPSSPIDSSPSNSRRRISTQNAPQRKPAFTPMRNAKNSFGTVEEFIVDTVQSPCLTLTRSGHIYMLTRDESPGYVRIGNTDDVETGLAVIKANCGYEPRLRYKSSRFSNVIRVKQLIYAELAELRRYDMTCVDLDGCGSRHDEWFEIDVQRARKVIRRWMDWIQKKPYNTQGDLLQRWEDYSEKWLDHCTDSDNEPDCPFGTELIETPPPDEECAICSEPVKAGEEQMDSCAHCHKSFWHDECIKTWLKENPSCPHCRGSWVLDEDN